MPNDPTDPLGGKATDILGMGTGFLTGGGMIPPINTSSSSAASASQRVGFTTGSFSGGLGLNVKNILLIGLFALGGLYLYKKVK